MHEYDLLLKNGHVLDPAQGIDKNLDLAFADGKIAAIGSGIAPDTAAEVRDVSGKLVTAGLIDMHTISIGVEHRWELTLTSTAGTVRSRQRWIPGPPVRATLPVSGSM